ncbi:hypothetical protein MJD09_17225 [bacterium]|nr:hypothetical protein [bacterium]
MKKKLFAVAIVVSLYVILMLVFAAADERGNVARVLSDIGLSESTAIAATQLSAAKAGTYQPSFYGPMSRRPKKKSDKKTKPVPR